MNFIITRFSLIFLKFIACMTIGVIKLNRDVYHTIVFNEQSDIPTRNKRSAKLSRLPFLNVTKTRNVTSQLTGKNALYLLENAVGRIYQILRYIELSGPYVNKYGPIIKEMPTMYKLMKAFNELDAESSEDDGTPSSTENHSNLPKQSRPKLYI